MSSSPTRNSLASPEAPARTGRRLHLIAAAAVFLVVAGACTAAAPPPAPLGPLKIGILVPFTESAIDSDIGASQRRAADLYLKLKGGTLAGREIQLVYNDESSLDPGINTVRITQFLEQDHVSLLLGGVGTPAAYQLRDAAEAAKLVYLDTNATGNALTRTTPGCSPSCKSKFVFRVASSSWQLSEPLGEWAARSGPKDFFVISADDAFGTESAAAFTEGLQKHGGHATGRTTVPAKSGADWAKLAAAVKAQPTKRVFAALVTDDAEGFLAAWDVAGLRAAGYRLFGPGPLADAEVIRATKQAVSGVTTAYPWSPDLDNAANKAFVDAFKKAYQDDETHMPLAPDGYAFEMWEAMRVLEVALGATKGDVQSPDALIAALEVVTFDGPGGPFRFDATTHNPIVNLYVREVRAADGQLVNAVIDTIASVKDPGQ